MKFIMGEKVRMLPLNFIFDADTLFSSIHSFQHISMEGIYQMPLLYASNSKDTLSVFFSLVLLK